MREVECPYCEESFEIEHEGGYSEDALHEAQCPCCEKGFVYTVHVRVLYEAYKAPCLNGEPHQYERTNTYPPRFARLRCPTCGDEKPIEDAA